MQTAEQVLEIIRRLPEDEQKKLKMQLAIETIHAKDYKRRAEKLRSLLGSVDVGAFSNPDLDRESIYTRDDD